MNWEAVSTIAEIVGAIGIIVTLAYLAVQVKQGTQQALADNRKAALDRWIDAQCDVQETEEGAEFIRQALNDYDRLSPAQKGRLNSFMLKLLLAYDSIRVLHQKQLIELEIYSAIERDFVAVLKSHGATGWYENIKPTLPSDLVERLGALLETYDGPAVTEVLDYLTPDA